MDSFGLNPDGQFAVEYCLFILRDVNINLEDSLCDLSAEGPNCSFCVLTELQDGLPHNHTSEQYFVATVNLYWRYVFFVSREPKKETIIYLINSFKIFGVMIFNKFLAEFLVLIWGRGNFIGHKKGKGVRGSAVVKALCYKPEDLGFETR
jgi:hypothetical protein